MATSIKPEHPVPFKIGTFGFVGDVVDTGGGVASRRRSFRVRPGNRGPWESARWRRAGRAPSGAALPISVGIDQVFAGPEIDVECHDAGVGNVDQQPFGAVVKYDFGDGVLHACSVTSPLARLGFAFALGFAGFFTLGRPALRLAWTVGLLGLEVGFFKFILAGH